MSRTLTSLTVLVLCLRSTLSASCDSFQDVKMTVHPDDGHPYRVNITGCIQRIAFNKTITQALIKDQNIPKLGRDSVRNMKYLHNLVFDHCSINTIERQAFRNVPNLKTIRIEHGELTVVPVGVFNVVPILGRLGLSHNKIRWIDNGALGISTLKKLYCDHNELKDWKKEWFVNSTKLEILDFSYNRIEVLPRRSFDTFPQLKEIYFDHNELEVIESEAFKDIADLDYLGLKYNRLKTIHSRVFPNFITIELLAIDANYLNFISKKVMVTMAVKQVRLDGNPWKCPCLEQMMIWLHDTNATAVHDCLGGDTPVCSFPDAFSKNCTEVVDDDVTRTYLDELREINPPLEKYCARLD